MINEGARPTALRIPSPWSGDENDPLPWTYPAWFRLYRRTRQVRHRLGLHDWAGPGPAAERGRCTWCGASPVTGAETANPVGHPEDQCGRCGGPNVSWFAPSPLWNAVMRCGSINGDDDPCGIVCPTCFAVLAEERGVAQRWRLRAEKVLVPLELTTPSGRVWSEEHQRWVQPDDRVPVFALPEGAALHPWAGPHVDSWTTTINVDSDADSVAVDLRAAVEE